MGGCGAGIGLHSIERHLTEVLPELIEQHISVVEHCTGSGFGLLQAR